jgi:hypothetical protein
VSSNESCPGRGCCLVIACKCRSRQWKRKNHIHLNGHFDVEGVGTVGELEVVLLQKAAGERDVEQVEATLKRGLGVLMLVEEG